MSDASERIVGNKPGVLAQYVTGNAARALSADGVFPMPAAPAGLVSEATARTLAETYIHTFGARVERFYSFTRGKTVHVANLRSCGKPLFVSAALQFPADASINLQKFVGPHWLIELCDGATPTVDVAVSAMATQLSVVNGQIQGAIGRDFVSVGIPTRLATGTVTAEQAALAAAQLTGRRVTEVPQLVMPPAPSSPQAARWYIALDRPVSIRASGANVSRSTDHIYVGYTDEWRDITAQVEDALPTSSQPEWNSAANRVLRGLPKLTLLTHGAAALSTFEVAP